jgi:hypothetical protein
MDKLVHPGFTLKDSHDRPIVEPRGAFYCRQQFEVKLLQIIFWFCFLRERVLLRSYNLC